MNLLRAGEITQIRTGIENGVMSDWPPLDLGELFPTSP
jgi:hypothetical protein